MANIGVEWQFADHWSVDVPFYYSPYSITDTRKLSVVAVQPEVRYWLNYGGKGHFFGVHGHAAGFNVAVNDHGRYQDPSHALWGLGIGYGWATHLDRKKHWGLELECGFGFADIYYDTFENVKNGAKVNESADHKWYWGPTRVAVSISYKWYYGKKGGRR